MIYIGLRGTALRDQRDRPNVHTAWSSIMPGRVNPVPCESVIQVAAHVIGCDATITLCGQADFELNVTMPIVTLKLLEAIDLTPPSSMRPPVSK
jgi:fumarate hydratase class II